MAEENQRYEIWQYSKHKRTQLIQQGLAFSAQNQMAKYHNLATSRVEKAVHSRYLHRGYYCPSPIQHLIFVNSKRGRILKRETKRSMPTHLYFFDKDDLLRIAQWDSNAGSIYTEYLDFSGDFIYGYTFDSDGNLVSVSEERYESGRIQSYFRSSCYNDELREYYRSITCVEYERYFYDDINLSEADFYFSGRWYNHIESEEQAKRMFFGGHYEFYYNENGVLQMKPTEEHK